MTEPRRADEPGHRPWLGLPAALAFIAVVLLVDVAAAAHAVLIGFLALAPLLAAAVDTPRRTAVASAAATAAAVLAGLPSQTLGSLDHVLRVAVVIAVSVAALYVARARTSREERIRRMSEIVRVTQKAILREVPPRIGGVALGARYVSAQRGAGVGGDLYEVVPGPDRVRVIIGDVCGKGLPAVQLASAVIGAFRQSAIVRDRLEEVATDLDALVAREPRPAYGVTFVTAVLLEVRGPDLWVMSCGHPVPLRHRPGRTSAPLGEHEPDRPLGLGGRRTPPAHHTWATGERLLLYTDGLIEARDDAGRFFPLPQLDRPLSASSLPKALDGIWRAVRTHVGGEPRDDLALLLIERLPDAGGDAGR
ncbi:PP2C family protein-serine/threonine phosphatase [Micromonospora sp. WMMA1998]|uniref:PP2C family protein-serine/threonine phosphatase n=1 Tax=Micromonospora sp. WMMA1998 TaxID=3015167 RepID=UPI00248C7E06|nr:PP2C family protein-serine/threonine phosphatase [Micromonospora sp. WMMA1998]WBC16683.1 PP2C family protein-serine/threonine phosphatase [Micromonospora sp. WMMA1998]